MTETMKKRPRRNHRREPEIEIGGVDPMSVSAAFHKMSLCGRASPDSASRCSRASGHDEGNTKHVAAGTGSVESIWES